MPGAQSDSGLGVTHAGEISVPEEGFGHHPWEAPELGQVSPVPRCGCGRGGSWRGGTLAPSSWAARQREAGGKGGVLDTASSTQEGLGNTGSVFIVPRLKNLLQPQFKSISSSVLHFRTTGSLNYVVFHRWGN